jgi:hypothetical protein
MTRGKYAARATLRREDAGVRSDLASYQHHVKRLTAENASLRAELEQARRGHAAEARVLRAQRDEGLSPEVEALRQRLREESDRADRAVAHERDLLERWHRCFDRVIALGQSLGLTPVEAVELAVWTVAEDVNEARVIDWENAGRYGMSPDRMRAIYASQGKRHAADAVLMMVERAGEELNRMHRQERDSRRSIVGPGAANRRHL